MRCTSARISGTLCGCSGSPLTVIPLTFYAGITEVGDNRIFQFRVYGTPGISAPGALVIAAAVLMNTAGNKQGAR